jgi:mannose-6-phosphate isomerase-like protein (cupin superfamily)
MNKSTQKPKAFAIDIDAETMKNKNYRKVIYTDKKQQIVLMSIKPGEYIHREVHKGTQLFRIVNGIGIAEIGKTQQEIKLVRGLSLTIPPNTLHKLINTSKRTDLKIHTIYSPPNHKKSKIDMRQPHDEM